MRRRGRGAASAELPLALLTLGLGAPAAAHDRCDAGAAPAYAVAAVAVTPIIVRVLQDTLTPVPATDGLVHIAYAAQVTNLARDPIDIESLVPVDYLADARPTGENRVIDGHGADISGEVKLFAPPMSPDPAEPGAGFARRLPGGASGVAFFDVTYPATADAPVLLAHRIAARDPASGLTSETVGNPIRVACTPPVVLRPPLVGRHWWNGNGCCVVNAHRGATLPVNGSLEPPEQFAIDYAQVRDDGTCCTGPVRQLASWPFYGAPVLAAGTGTVVEVARHQPDQVPGQPVVGVTAANAGGNLVIQRLDTDHFVAYAHLRPGSIPASVVPGAVLLAGDKLGEVGNSGNSTAPHLHFQVMDRPSMLNAIGQPFVFERQTVEGRIQGGEVEADDRFEAGLPIVIDPTGAGVQRGRMPASGQVFDYGPP